jgi:CubicO group peptidase (beta-lactamase class C family)
MQILRWIILATLLFSGLTLAKKSGDFDEVERNAEQAVQKAGLPSLVIAIAKDGNIVYEHAFGYADVEARIPATVHTAYPLASATKPITATAMMALYQQKKIDLSMPVENYRPELRFHDSHGKTMPVSMLQLLSHTAGLGTYARIHYGDDIAKADSLDKEFQRYGVLVNPPGRIAEYSNLGYGLIGEIIERQSKKSFSSYIEKNVFRPLGMRDSFIDSPRKTSTKVASGYDTTLKRLPKLRNNTPGAGNAFASVHDLALFGMFHLDPDKNLHTPLTRNNVERMQRNPDPQAFQHYYGSSYYGLGWYIRENDNGHRVLWHEGGMPGASAIIKMLPEHGIVAVALTNRTDANDQTQAFADQLIKVLLPDYKPTPLNPVANYAPYSNQPQFLGRWAGKIIVDGAKLPSTLKLDSGGNGMIRYASTEAQIKAMVFGDSFISAFAGSLPTNGIAKDDKPFLLLKLVRTNNRLSGSVVAYSSPQRLDYLLPFAIELEQVQK